MSQGSRMCMPISVPVSISHRSTAAAHTHTHAHTHARAHTRIHTQTHTLTHTHTHTRIHTSMLPSLYHKDLPWLHKYTHTHTYKGAHAGTRVFVELALALVECDSKIFRSRTTGFGRSSTSLRGFHIRSSGPCSKIESRGGRMGGLLSLSLSPVSYTHLTLPTNVQV